MSPSDDSLMSIDNPEKGDPPVSTDSSNKKKTKTSVTVEDSMAVIAELIQEIQNSDTQDITSQVTAGPVPPPSRGQQASIPTSLPSKKE